jgi:hypothetical protein
MGQDFTHERYQRMTPEKYIRLIRKYKQAGLCRAVLGLAQQRAARDRAALGWDQLHGCPGRQNQSV